MSERLDVPDNMDNCISRCPRLEHLFPDGNAKIAEFCIKEHCPGPIVEERVIDISDVNEEETTVVSLHITCGSDSTARLRLFSDSELVEYSTATDEIEINPLLLVDDAAILMARTLSQDEIRTEFTH